MRWRTCGGWLEHLRARGLVREVRGADAYLEVGAITDLNAKRGKWVLLFDKIGGYDQGFRILTGSLLDAERVEYTLELRQRDGQPAAGAQAAFPAAAPGRHGRRDPGPAEP